MRAGVACCGVCGGPSESEKFSLVICDRKLTLIYSLRSVQGYTEGNNMDKLPTELLVCMFDCLNSSELCKIDRVSIFLNITARNLSCRRQLPDGSYRKVKRIRTTSSGVSVCDIINTRPERPRDYIN